MQVSDSQPLVVLESKELKNNHPDVENNWKNESKRRKIKTSSDHERKKQFKCDICNSNFGGKGNLNAHVTKVHEEKSNSYVIFVILNLEKTYVSRNMLQQSMKEVNHTYRTRAIINRSLILTSHD